MTSLRALKRKADISSDRHSGSPVLPGSGCGVSLSRQSSQASRFSSGHADRRPDWLQCMRTKFHNALVCETDGAGACFSMGYCGTLREKLGVKLSASRAQGEKHPRFLGKSHLDRIREERVTPFVQGSHEVRLGMDCSTFAIAPFSSVGIERKVSHVVVAGLFPMVDRQRLTIVLAIETGPHVFYAARFSLREDELQPVSPQHQNVSPFRAKETTKAQEFAIGLIGCMIARGHIGVEQLNPHAVVIAGMRSLYESS